MTERPPDPSSMLLPLLEPAVGQLSSFLDPAAVQRVMEAILAEVDLAVVPEPRRTARANRIAQNVAWLGLTPKRFVATRFAQRHVALQIRRQASEVVCVFADVDALLRWGEATASVKGIRHAVRVARANHGAVVVSAHLGPLVYYGAALAFFLRKRTAVPTMTMVANPPSNPRIERQLAAFGARTASTIHYVVKEVGGEDAIKKLLDDRLSRGEWVLIQVDVETGGRSRRALSLFERKVELPGIWGAIRLAARHGVPLLPARVFQNRAGGIGLQIEPALETGRQPDEVARAPMMCSILEQWIRRDPAEWGMLARVHRMAVDGG